VEFIVTAPLLFSVSVWLPTVPLPIVYAAADVSNRIVLIVTLVPRFSVVLPFPALLKVAVSPDPGTGVALQFVPVAQIELVVPFHVALAATAESEIS
jgi:hypothetical protein